MPVRSTVIININDDIARGVHRENDTLPNVYAIAYTC
jgi:hypothetical protein